MEEEQDAGIGPGGQELAGTRGRERAGVVRVVRGGGGEQGTGGQNYFRWSDMCRRMGSYTGGGRGDRKEAVRTICFRSYNICNGHNFGLDSALLGTLQANMDLGIFQYMKVKNGIYTRELVGYRVMA